jgi:hypothetical protein
VLTTKQEIKGDQLTLRDLETTMIKYWRQTKGNRASINKEEDETEVSLVVVEGAKGQKQKRQKFKGKCFNCGGINHLAKDCWEKPENADKRPSGWKSKMNPSNKTKETANPAVDNGPHVEFMLNVMTFPKTQSLLSDPNVWIRDIGASVHMTPHKVGMINMRDATREDYVTIGNGSTKVATKIGDIPGVICDIKGNPRDSTVIKNVTYVPNSAYNLFSLMKMMKAGWELNRKGGHLAITRGNHKLVFDIEIATPKGTIFAVYMKRNTEIVNASTDHTKMSIQKAHDKLGHMSEALTRKAAKSLNWDLTPGTLEPCESCAAGKARQKNVPKNYDSPMKLKILEEYILTSLQLNRRKASQEQRSLIGALLSMNIRK